MASQISATYHTWSAQCFSLIAQAETVLACTAPREAALDALVSQMRALAESTHESAAEFPPEELRKAGRSGLLAAQQLGTVLERLPADHPFRAVAEDFIDEMETLAESADPETARAVERAWREFERGESTPIERVSEPAE